MKLGFTIFLLCITFFSNAQVGIGTTTPDSSAILDISSSDKGILIPRLTSTNRKAMPNVSGMLVYDETLKGFYYNDGTQWYPLISSLTKKEIIQSGTYNLGASAYGINYYNITFSESFSSIPSVTLTLGECTGTDSTQYNSVKALYLVEASTTGFSIAVHSSGTSYDICIDWTATLKTQ